MNNLYVKQLVKQSVEIPISSIKSNKSSSIEDLIINEIKNKIGNKCIKEGFVDKENIKLVNRSIGKIKPEYFNSFICYNCTFELNICNPLKNQEVEATVEAINKMGIKAVAEPLYIILAKQHHLNKEIFDTIEIGDKINVEILATRFELYDTQIDVIGKLNQITLQKISEEQPSVIEDKDEINEDDQQNELFS